MSQVRRLVKVLLSREQALQERGAAAKIPHDEERAIDRLLFVNQEKHIVQPEAEPGEEGPQRPDAEKEK